MSNGITPTGRWRNLPGPPSPREETPVAAPGARSPGRAAWFACPTRAAASTTGSTGPAVSTSPGTVPPSAGGDSDPLNGDNPHALLDPTPDPDPNRLPVALTSRSGRRGDGWWRHGKSRGR